MLSAIQPAKDSLDFLVVLCAQLAVSAPKPGCSCCCGPCGPHSKKRLHHAHGESEFIQISGVFPITGPGGRLANDCVKELAQLS
ncbi:hypothetical protein BX661DRAFT_179016 [Kickxella alabastrina]|uniref:uncharacterized protein n=1 Tax=Kickxella alabastrina TaxID=61397 RepID=UPI002220ECAB|nr:uncharacterized protein BX661DRAFT_179016 [Kickxella alabastrina]KAI7833021.1 hypothetical protein BX661DRAFT_179016 [Kickxella alabastrina]